MERSQAGAAFCSLLILSARIVGSFGSPHVRIQAFQTYASPTTTFRSTYPLPRHPPTGIPFLSLNAEDPSKPINDPIQLKEADISGIGVGGGTVFGCTALVAGTTVGAGIIALPAKTVAAGFVPSALVLILGWAYMAATGLLIAEVNVQTLCTLDDRDAVSMNSMAEETLGTQWAAGAASAAFLFLHYALMTAYVIQGGSLLVETVGKVGVASHMMLPKSFSVVGDQAASFLGPTIFTSLLGGAMFGLSQKKLEALNTVLVVGVVLTFVALLGFGVPRVEPELLTRADYGAVLQALPLMPVVYVYQTVVPTLCSLLQCDLRMIRTAILAGTAIPLVMFLSWSVVILGTVPYDAAAVGDELIDPLEALRAGGDAFGDTVLGFSLLAVATSFLGFSYGLVDFLADLFGWDGIGATANPGDSDAVDDDSVASLEELLDSTTQAVNPSKWQQKVAIFSLAMVPPVAIAVSDPSIFFEALDNAGAYGILVLFGILPAAMSWSQRYNPDEDPIVPASLPGGRASLVSILAIAAFVIGLETYEKFVTSVS